MFRKRVKKNYPPGTFIPTAARTLAILQLCLAFSLFLWEGSQPFMGDLFRTRSKMLVYQDVMGIKNPFVEEGNTSRLDRNHQRFEALPIHLKKEIIHQYNSLEQRLKDSFISKLNKMFEIYTYKLSSYEISWIFLSIIVPILLLKRVEGARQATWLLPILTLLYSFHAHIHENSLDFSKDLFPKEEFIINNYLQEPLSSKIGEQQNQLSRGWNLYLIKEWAHENPSQNQHELLIQSEKGEFAFNIHRLQMMNQVKSEAQGASSLFTLILYFGWNFFFAWYVNRSLKKEILNPARA